MKEQGHILNIEHNILIENNLKFTSEFKMDLNFAML